jgi:hypothetical protein
MGTTRQRTVRGVADGVRERLEQRDRVLVLELGVGGEPGKHQITMQLNQKKKVNRSSTSE